VSNLAEESVQMYNNPRNRLRRPFFTDWTAGDLIVLAVTVTTVIVMIVQIGFFGALVLGIPLLFLNFRFTYGRGWNEVAAIFKDLFIIMVLRDTLFLAHDQDHSPWPIRWIRQKRYRRPVNRYVLPIRHMVVEAQGVQYGIIQQLDRPYDHLPVRGRGSNFSSYDGNRQYATSSTLALQVDQVAAQTDLRIGVSYVRMTRPVNTYNTALYLALNGQPLLLDPDKFELDEKLAMVAKQVQKGADEIFATQRQNGVAETTPAAVITIKRTRDMEKAVKGKSSDEMLHELKIIELGRLMVDAIRNSGMNVRDLHCMSYGELCQFIRGGYDVTELSFHEGVPNASVEVVTREDVLSGKYDREEMGAVKDPFPVMPTHSIVVGDDFLCMDGNWISTFRIVRNLERFHVSKIQSVYHHSSPAGVWSSMSSVGETISGEAETRTLLYRQSLEQSVAGASPFQRVIANPKKLRWRNKINQQAMEMSASSLAQQYNDVICVVASTKKEMIANRNKMIGIYRANGFSCAVIKGRCRQIDGYLTGAYGVNRL
jgi:hypothetical protein